MLSALVPALLLTACGGTPPSTRHLVIVVDGLRPDYVTPDVMPTVTALRARGVHFTAHHAVYPTVTRVNASSISTGAYPERHGLLGNSVFFPRVDPARFLDTSDRGILVNIAEREGRLLTASTLGEALQAAGRALLVVSSGSTGSAFLNNHVVAGGAVLHPQFALPSSLDDRMKALGPRPAAGAVSGALDRYAVDAFLRVGLAAVDPSVTVMWLGELDAASHANGVGHPATIEALRRVDAEVGRVEDGLRARGLFDRYNLWVTSDHGFSTHAGAIDLGAVLKPLVRARSDGAPAYVADGGAIYVPQTEAGTIAAIVASLQRTSSVGAIFTRAARPGDLDGQIPGTLSFDAVRWGHERSADILFSPEWDDGLNAYGMRGTTAASGVAGHGSASRRDVHATLIASGPDIKRGAVVDSPSANVDLAPTVLTLLGLPVPSSMQGRPLRESFAGEAALASGAVRVVAHTARTTDGRYAVTGSFSLVTAGGTEYRYFDAAAVVRR